MLADQFIRKLTSFSIGTNDLIQYTMADRMNSFLPLPTYNPSILRLINNVIQGSCMLEGVDEEREWLVIKQLYHCLLVWAWMSSTYECDISSGLSNLMKEVGVLKMEEEINLVH